MLPLPPRSPLFPYTTLFRSILAALAAAGCFLLTRPFNFYGGGGAIANRYFLPLYPAFWFAAGRPARAAWAVLEAILTRSEEHTSELQSLRHLVCRLLLEKKN